MLTTLKKAQKLISAEIECYLPKSGILSAVVKYSVLPVGKCLRGNLVMEIGKMASSSEKKQISLAAAIELIHAYSLVHDDLPALDNDDTRRGKPSCHKAFGEANAILAGNFILMLAFKIISENDPKTVPRTAQFVNEMVEGQALDISITNNTTNDEMIKIYKMKTGALFAISAILGGRLADCNAEELLCLENYGYNAGIAFQIADDISDNSGFVKNIGRDSAVNLMNKYLYDAESNLKSITLKTDYLAEFIDYIKSLTNL